jgi:hypothetical protein
MRRFPLLGIVNNQEEGKFGNMETHLWRSIANERDKLGGAADIPSSNKVFRNRISDYLEHTERTRLWEIHVVMD